MLCKNDFTRKELFEIVPMSFPMTHVVDADVFPGIAKFPVEQWLEQVAPCLTTHGWIKLCLKIAERDMDNLENIFHAAIAAQSNL